MASAYSIQRNRQGWIDPTDQEFTLKGLMFKQQTYDANRAKIDSMIEQHRALQLARDVDKDYLNERLQTLINNVNYYGAQDLGSNSVTQGISYFMSQAVDENVMTAIQETSKIRAYQAEVQRIKEKTPEQYHQLNEAFGLAPAQEYMQNEQVGAKIKGSLNYTPYKDIEGEISKTLIDIQKSAKDGVLQQPDPLNPGRLITTVINGKSPNELRQIALGMMGNRFDDQLKVNVWDNTGGFKTIDQQVERATAEYNGLIDNKTEELLELKSRLTGNITDTERATLKDQEKQLENAILEHKQMRDSFSTNPVGTLVFLEKNKIARNMGDSLGLLQTTSVKYDKDDYYFSQLDAIRTDKKLALDIEAQNNLNEYRVQDLKLREAEINARLTTSAQKAAGVNDGTSGSTGSTEGALPGGIVMENIGLGEGEENMKSYKTMWQEDIAQKYNEASTYSQKAMQTIVGISNGTIAASPDKVKAAKAVVAQHSQAGGTLDTSNAGNATRFMTIFSRGDAYNALDFIPIDGVATNVKQGFREKVTAWSKQKRSYEAARLAAQTEEAAGMKRPYGDNTNFRRAAEAAVPFSVSKQANIAVTKDNLGTVNTLISMGEEAKSNGAMYEAVPNMPIKIVDNRDGTFQVNYYSPTKDGDKNTVNVLRSTKVNYEAAKKIFPALDNFHKPTPSYTLSTMGTKPLYSVPLKFEDRNSERHFHMSEMLDRIGTEGTSGVRDNAFLDSNGAKNTIMSTLITSSPLKPEEKQMMNQLVTQLLSPRIMDQFKTSVEYGYSTNSSAGIGYTNIVDKRGSKIASVNLGATNSLDNYVKLNEMAPQVLYSKMIMNEINTMMQNYRATHVLEATPAIKKIING